MFGKITSHIAIVLLIFATSTYQADAQDYFIQHGYKDALNSSWYINTYPSVMHTWENPLFGDKFLTLQSTPEFQDILKQLKNICAECDVVPIGTKTPCPGIPPPRPLSSKTFTVKMVCPNGMGYDNIQKKCRKFADD